MQSTATHRINVRWLMMLYTAIAMLFCCLAASAQPHFLCPRPFGILQVRDDGAHLRIIGTLTDDAFIEVRTTGGIKKYDTTWHRLGTVDGAFDTLFVVPIVRSSYSLEWRTMTSSGIISGLNPGHVIGITGQSNAEGNCWQMNEHRMGDIRMLRSELEWLPAAEPTANVAGGPWIVMANLLWRSIADSLPIGIVNTAVGGSGLTVIGVSGRWHRNPLQPNDNSVYGRALSRFRMAGSELEAICWIQGEADGDNDMDGAAVYRLEYGILMDGFEHDLGSPIDAYHVQISGDNRIGMPVASNVEVREAQCVLPRSTLVGTAAGQPILPDGLHFDVSTNFAVGKMFAGAILKKRYGLQTPYYPPLIQDSIAVLDSAIDLSGHETYFFAVHFQLPQSNELTQSNLSLLNPRQQFDIQCDGFWSGTNNVWSRVSDIPGVVYVGLKNDTIRKGHLWSVGYMRTAGAEAAPLAILVEDGNGELDTTFAATFTNLPVVGDGMLRSEEYAPDFSESEIQPNPVSSYILLDLLSFRNQPINIDLRNSSGAVVYRRSFYATSGDNEATLPVAGIASGVYWVVVLTNSESESKKVIIQH